MSKPTVPEHVDNLSSADIKEATLHVEELDTVSKDLQGPLAAEIAEVDGLSPEEWAAAEKKLVRKVSLKSMVRGKPTNIQVDLRLLPVLFILLILNYLDRNALA
jgi:lipoate-protein ligase A